MKHLKKYKLFEQVEDSISIISELNRHKKVKYYLDQNGLVNVDGSVDLRNLYLTKIPIKFGIVTGYFNCISNRLTSLQGCPIEVREYFSCSNNQLTSLQGSPIKVVEGFYCHSNQLTSLQGSPKEVGGHFDCTNNQLTSLQGCPTKVGGYFDCSDNQLTSLEGCPIKVVDDFRCHDNPLEHIGHLLVCKIEGKIYADQHLLDEYNVLKNQEIEI